MDVRESVQIVKDATAEFKKESAVHKENIKLFSSSIKDVRAMREEAEKHLKTIKLLEQRLIGMSGDTGDLELNNDDDEGVTPSEKPAKTTKPAKSTKSTKSAKTTKTKKVTKSKKGESNRAKNDLAILAEIERQAKENPNLK